MANRFPLIFNSGAGQIQELAASDNLDLTSSNLVNAGILFTSSGSQTAPSLQIGSGTTYNPGLYSPGTDQVAVATNGTGKLFVNSTGDLGVNTGGTQGTKLHVIGGNVWSSNFYEVARFQKSSGTAVSLGFDNTAYVATIGAYSHDGTASNLSFWTYSGSGDAQERLRITSGGLVGIGTSSPATTLDVVGGYFTGGSNRTDNTTKSFGLLLPHTSNATNPVNIIGALSTSGQNLVYIGGSDSNLTGTSATTIHFYTAANATTANGTERMRITSAGLVGIGTTSPSSALEVYATAPVLTVNSAAANASSILFQQNGTTYARFRFDGNNVDIGNLYSNGATIFNAGNAERARIDSSGRLLVGTTNTNPAENNVNGAAFGNDGRLFISTTSNEVIRVNRKTSDGTLIFFHQDGTEEGSISVSGTTVSYNGAHLSRWSQLPSGAERIEILRGSVLSNLDEMCEWGEEDNEQLNRMKVSTVEGDKNVSGVFQSWDDDDDTYTNDFYCAMTGDFIIRIAEGTTIERGDLLMSAGDGTAKPQDDDIIRSKTIAKVTSTNVSCTYEDGSYCVPCVLMAC